QPSGDRHTGWTRHRLDPTPLPQLLGRHTTTIPNTTDKTPPRPRSTNKPANSKEPGKPHGTEKRGPRVQGGDPHRQG
ncbi:hypothetical protein, partial [Mycobacterium sp.]|uniref:hypothetical protein n=1 Tax=Mycobacterium sp. TaxID=1785 RepID=UPI003D6C0707